MDQNLIFAIREMADYIRLTAGPRAEVRQAAKLAEDYVLSEGVEFVDEDEAMNGSVKLGKEVG